MMLFDQVQEAVSFIRRRTDVTPRVGIVLGTGLGKLADEIDPVMELSYKEIPHFPVPTVAGHSGRLVFSQWSGVPVVAMAGRFHYYEGYSLRQATLPIRVMKFLGATHLILSNAAGSVNPAYEMGDIVLIRDHINLLPDNPLRGPNDERFGVRFPDMLNAYDPQLRARALGIAQSLGIRAHEGVYAALSGPNFETPAEYEFLHRIGADLAGMSTVPEVITGRHMGMKIFAASLVTDLGYPRDRIQETTHEHVLQVSESAEPRLKKIVERLVEDLSGELDHNAV